jgi:hypothetical protein
MALVKLLQHIGTSGNSYECQVLLIAAAGTATQLDHVDGLFRSAPVTPKVPMVEIGTTGVFIRAESRAVWADGNYVLAVNEVGATSNSGGAAFKMASDTEVSSANITHVIGDPIVAGSNKNTNWGGTS